MDWTIQFDEAVSRYLPDLKVVCDEPMSRHTTFRIGGPAKRMAYPSSREQLVLLLNFAEKSGADPLVIGNGSNLLAPDEGLNRLVIDTSAHLNRVEQTAEHIIRADAGATLARTADLACKLGLTGLEFAHGIPGTVGGGVCMNAGAYGGEMKQVLRSASVLFPEAGVRTLTCEELELGYRHSLLTEHPEAVVLGAEFALTPGDPAQIRETMRELMARRKASQPLEWPSAGSTFKRPQGAFCRNAHRPVRIERADRRRRAGVGKARRLPHQPRRGHLCGYDGADPSGAAAGAGCCRRPAGAGGQNRKISG